MWDPSFHYENLRLRAKQGSRGTPRVPVLALLAQRFATVVEEVFNEANLGYHFSGIYDSLDRLRDVTISVYPDSVVVALGSRGEPLRFWELFVFLVGWVPGVTGIPIPAWEIRQLEVNRDHVLEEDVGPLWAVSRPIPLARAVKAMAKIYEKEERKARSEVRLSGEIAKDVLLDDMRAMLEWSGRMDR